MGLLSVKQFLEAKAASQRLKVLQVTDLGIYIPFQSMLNLCSFSEDARLEDSDCFIPLLQAKSAHLTGQMPNRELDISQNIPYFEARTSFNADERMRQEFLRRLRRFRVRGYVIWDRQNSGD